ncbi:MAG: hypothetical protein NC395_06370 [Prevotella sp.]|nr:hypothetical protein [Prevotella sp.]
MENIITRILEIEQDARERIEEANRKRDEMIAEAEAEKERIIDEKVRNAEEKLRKLGLDEKRKTDEKLEEIERIKNDEIKRLDDVYGKNHAEWEKEIFDAVIASV